MLIVMVIIPPSFHVEDSANDIPARQVADDDSLDDDVEVDVTGVVGVVCVPLVLVLVLVLVAVEEEEAVVATVLVVAVLATLELLDDEADPAEHGAVLHSHEEAWEHVGEPPPPQGTRR